MLHPLADPNCKECGGLGQVKVPMGNKPPKSRLCSCTYVGQMNRKLENSWEGLSQASPTESSPLLDHAKENLWITCEPSFLRRHLRHVITKNPFSWKVKVITDKELMAAWLATAALAGVDILDKEAFAITANKLSIEDLVQPYDLVILRLGVKMARNSAMPEVLMESLALRDHLRKPTWVWDQPTRALAEGHRCYSLEVAHELSRFHRINAARENNVRATNGNNRSPAAISRPVRGRRTLSQDMKRK